MAYLNEFPHFNANTMNLDWLLEQYATFNKRLQELHDHFDEAVATMNEELASYKAEYEREFEVFEARIDATIQEYNEKVDSINQNIGGYVNEYLTENITEILETNPVVETKYEKIGYIDTNETCTLELEEDKLYEIMTIDYALNMHKGIAVNNACKLTQCPFESAEFVHSFVYDMAWSQILDADNVFSITDYMEAYALTDERSISLSSANNILTVTNNGTNRVRVYAKIIGEL